VSGGLHPDAADVAAPRPAPVLEPPAASSQQQQQLWLFLLAASVRSTTVDRLLHLLQILRPHHLVDHFVSFHYRSIGAITLVLFRHGLQVLLLESFHLLILLAIR